MVGDQRDQPIQAVESGAQVRNPLGPKRRPLTLEDRLQRAQRLGTINPETFYWAHATFLAGIYRTADLVHAKPLTRAEKEQLFEESKEWLSLYGVDDSAQPQTYDEFIAYWHDVINNQLIDSTVARYTDGFATKELPAPPYLPPPLKMLLWHRIGQLVRLTNVGAMEPLLRERLGLGWTDQDERNFQRFCALMRRSEPLYRRLPLQLRYDGSAVAAFKRERINPDKTTLETARAALARARAAAATETWVR